MIRPAIWGVFISVVLFLLLLITKSGCSAITEKQWNDRKAEYEQHIVNKVEEQFRKKAQGLLDQAKAIAAHRELFNLIKEHSQTSLASAFELLNRNRTEDVTVDIVDSNGVVLAWSGRSVLSNYKKVISREPIDSAVIITQTSLRTYLSVGALVPNNSVFVVVSRPLESNYPISSRFVSRASFSEDLSNQLGLKVRLLFDASAHTANNERSLFIALKNFKGHAIAFAELTRPSIISEVLSIEVRFDKYISFVVGVGSLLLLFVIIVKRLALRDQLAGVVLLSIVLWGVRYLWLAVGFPSHFVTGFLFDPALFASPFYGLTTSLGELSLSVLILTINVMVILNYGFHWYKSTEYNKNLLSLSKTFIYWLVVIALAFGLQWFVRGFGAAMRSFVFDSTLRYQDPTSFIPDVPVLLMHLNILFLALSFLGVLVAVFLLMEHLLSRLLPSGQKNFPLWVMTFIVAGAFGVFLLINQVPQVPVSHQILFFVLGIAYAGWLKRGLHQDAKRGITLGRLVLLGGCCAFIISALLLDSKLHEKERQRIETLAEELIRPTDNWLSFVVTEGLHSMATIAVDRAPDLDVDSSGNFDLAFILWSQTLMGREGYNSAVVVYNPLGKEVSRFTVGLTSYEQFELLSKIFNTEEEVLHIVERKIAGGTTKYYGGWTTIRDDEGRVLGTVAVMLSANQRNLFRGEAPEAIRTPSRERFEKNFRKVAISEYQHGTLVTTMEQEFFKGMGAPRYVLTELQLPDKRFVWSEQHVGLKDFDILYIKDGSDPNRMLAISLEALDIRWHLFNLVKMFMVYVLFFGVTFIVSLLRLLISKRRLIFGFREKLITSFAVLAVLPLVLMAYYNRQLAIERVEEMVARDLSQDLDLIQQRILNTVLDEKDFFTGVNNDYCEVVASELGADFSVYNKLGLQASSRPELYRTAILDSRLTGSAYTNSVVLGKNFFKDSERIGEVEYVVGYRPLFINNQFVAVLSVPALYRQSEIDEELAQRNAFTLGAYAAVLIFIVTVGLILANRLSKPLRELSDAAKVIGHGNLDIQLTAKSDDEVGKLVRSFNEMAKELKAGRENLAQAERELAWKEMAKQVAHEIKNPLTPIKLSVQHLQRAYKDGVKDFGGMLEKVTQTVVEQIDVLSRIASEFSNFARMPERKFERVNLGQILSETMRLFGEVRGIEFRAKISDTPAMLIADGDELRRVFINILRNSVQAMDKGGVITIESSVAHNLCTISINDTGAGIPEEIRSKVFQPNFSTKTDGMGLGLAISQKIIQDLNGTIELYSEVGKGTTVEMKIPIKLS